MHLKKALIFALLLSFLFLAACSVSNNRKEEPNTPVQEEVVNAGGEEVEQKTSTPTPTPTSSPEPTSTPTPEPTSTPTPEPTSEPEPEVQPPAGIQVHNETVSIPGLTKTYEFLFLADTHVSLVDDRDPDVAEKAKARYQSFVSYDGYYADQTFSELMKYVSIEKPDMLILGGDIIDSAMYASIDFVTKEINATFVPYMYGMGNHDFEYGYEYYTDNAFQTYLPRLGGISDSNRSYQTTEYEDLIVMTVDDYSNRINQDALEELYRIYSLGKPIIITLHVPIEPTNDDSLWEMSKNIWGATDFGTSRVLLGSRSIAPDETTSRFISLIEAEDSPVRIVLAGHIHFYHKDNLTQHLVQVVTGAGYNKEITRLVVTP